MSRRKCDFLVVGGGIVGLATAVRLQSQYPEAAIILLEKETRFAKHQTGRNSGVIHAGVYYQPGSAKARFCIEGSRRTVQFCEEEGIPYERRGKLIVATNELEAERLSDLERRAEANGVQKTMLEKDALREREPSISGLKALHVTASAIVDYEAISVRLGEKLYEAGAEIVFGERLLALHEEQDLVLAETTGSMIEAKYVIACAGLAADRVAEMSGLANDFAIVPFRGEYFRLPDKHNEIVSHLIYPVPDPSYPFLGVHLTPMIDGCVTVGPNAMLSLGRENYDANLPVPGDLFRAAAFPGLWKLMASNLSAGFAEFRASVFKRHYLKLCQKYCPKLELDDLLPYPTGIRAQAVDRSGNLLDDFLIKQTRRCLHVCNAPSPAATSAFPIADEIARRVTIHEEAVA
ncbi:MAG: L-2-hydroxyglutarate oxidase [Pseudomonadota bacterium]